MEDAILAQGSTLENDSKKGQPKVRTTIISLIPFTSYYSFRPHWETQDGESE